MTYKRKLIEVALPLEVINKESARKKSIRYGHPTQHAAPVVDAPPAGRLWRNALRQFGRRPQQPLRKVPCQVL